ncbi:MAG TPA: dephospho-CoA kinase [Phycisphaerales bacterium]|nr:dephospho-CoA kinase [Phycisphaerales bacterium]
MHPASQPPNPPTGLLRRYVPEGERIILWLHPSPWFIVLRSFWVIAVVMLIVVGIRYGAGVIDLPVVVDFAAWIGAGILVAVVVWQSLEWLSRLYVLTDRRLIAVAGVVRQSISDVPLRNVRNLVIVRSLADRLLGLGTLGAATAGTANYEVVWVELEKPNDVMRLVRKAVDDVVGPQGGTGLPTAAPQGGTGLPTGAPPHPLILGLTGGIGAGKSAVARLLEQRNFLLIDSDKDAKEALDRPEVRSQLVQWWGDRVLTPEGTANRKAIAEIIFSDPAQRARLEALIHPLVKADRAQVIARAAREHRRGVVVDAPLLFEAGSDKECDFVLFIDAPRDQRLARVASRGWDEAELTRREIAQLPLEEKRRRADTTIVNDSTIEALQARVDLALNDLLARPRPARIPGTWPHPGQ